MPAPASAAVALEEPGGPRDRRALWKLEAVALLSRSPWSLGSWRLRAGGGLLGRCRPQLGPSVKYTENRDEGYKMSKVTFVTVPPRAAPDLPTANTEGRISIEKCVFNVIST